MGRESIQIPTIKSVYGSKIICDGGPFGIGRQGGRVWLTGWNKRIKITISHANIDSDLVNFPLLVYISAASGTADNDVTAIFDEVGANSKKIAVTKSDEVTECYVEIEKWDNANEKAWLWVMVPSIAGASDTILYVYYDNDHADNDSYVGVPGSVPGKAVWDENFVSVFHFTEGVNATVVDSKGNQNGALNQTDHWTTSGIIGNCYNFDGTDDYLTVNHFDGLDITDKITMEAWIYPDGVGDYGVCERDPAQYGDPYGVTIYNGTGYVALNSAWRISAVGTYPSGGWSYITATYDKDLGGTAEGKLYDGETQVGTVDYAIALATDANALRVGIYKDGAFDGMIDEFRLSKIARTASWVKASYNAGNDNLLTYGTEET